MQLAKQLFPDKYKVLRNVAQESTSKLLSAGPFYHDVKPGIISFLPIGKKIFSKIEELCLHEANKLAFESIDITQVIPTAILSLGEDIHKGFLDQFIFLTDRMKQYHLLSTPEPFFISLLKQGLQSYRQLPIQLIFAANFYRQLNKVQGILKTREFKMLAGTWLGDSRDGMTTFSKLTDRLSDLFSLPLHKSYNDDLQFLEYFYLHKDGEESYQAAPAISLAMAYVYGKHKKIKTTYRTAANKNGNACMITYGLGLQRILFVLFDHYRDEAGFNLPSIIRPFDIAIIPTKDQHTTAALELAKKLTINSEQILVDDRHQVKVIEKARLADFLGIPIKVFIKNNIVSLEYRANQHGINPGGDLEKFMLALNKEYYVG